MLFQLHNFIQREQYVSAQQIARVMQIDVAALQPLLDLLIKKSKIQRVTNTSSCHSPCNGCATGMSYYSPI
jgi:hypothetical protein